MHIQADHIGLLCRLYDSVTDNPNELSIGRATKNIVWMTMVDRDGGNTELTMNVSREELTAALALIDAPMVSVDAPDGGAYAR
jgi:hypothetical protein